MNLKQLILNEEDNKFSYLLNILTIINKKGSSTGKKLPVEKQHIIISFLEDYIKQVQLERMKGKLFYKT